MSSSARDSSDNAVRLRFVCCLKCSFETYPCSITLWCQFSSLSTEERLLEACRPLTSVAPPIPTVPNIPTIVANAGPWFAKSPTLAIPQIVVANAAPVRSTPGRPQSKAPIEGAFGLFQQSMSPLYLHGTSARDIARSYLQAVMTAWFRGRNGRPRKRLGGLSPAQAYSEAAPTPEEIQRAMRALRERQRRQEKAMETLQAKRDPVRLQFLELKSISQNGAAGLIACGSESFVRTYSRTELLQWSRNASCCGVILFEDSNLLRHAHHHQRSRWPEPPVEGCDRERRSKSSSFNGATNKVPATS
jgi:hypothetical protein